MGYIQNDRASRKEDSKVQCPRGDSKLGDSKESFPCGHKDHQPGLHPQQLQDRKVLGLTLLHVRTSTNEVTLFCPSAL